MSGAALDALARLDRIVGGIEVCRTGTRSAPVYMAAAAPRAPAPDRGRLREPAPEWPTSGAGRPDPAFDPPLPDPLPTDAPPLTCIVALTPARRLIWRVAVSLLAIAAAAARAP